MNKTFKKAGSLALSAMMAFSIVGSNGLVVALADEGLKNPETDAVVFATEAMDGNFNPFFATSGPDTEIVAQTQISMLTSDALGNPVCGQDQPTVALDYKSTMIGADGKEVKNGTDAVYTDYEFIIKKGIKFSDGVELTMKDVLFNLYVYLDPVYMGSSTIYSTDIVGLQAYRSQDPEATDDGDNSTGSFYVQAEQRVQAIIDYLDPDIGAEESDQINADIEYTKELFLEELQSDWTAHAGTLESYEKEYRFTEDWEVFYWNEGIVKPWTERNENGALVIKKDDQGRYMTSLDKEDDALREVIEEAKADEDKIKEYTDKGEDRELAISHVVRDVAIATVYETYVEDNEKLIEILSYWATAGNIRDEFASEAKSKYFENLTNGGDLKVRSVEGVTVGTTTEDYKGNLLGESHDVLKIRINKVDPKAIWNFSFTVAPVHYYAGEEYKNKINYTNADEYYFGVEFADKDFFDNVLKDDDKSGLPVGAGVYQASNSAGGDADRTTFYNNNNVYFKRNDYFYTVGTGLSNAKIKYMTYTVVPSNQIISYLQKGTIHFGEPNAKQSNINEINKYKHLGYAMYDTSGYGYVGVNPKYVPDIEVRQAIMKAMDTASIVKNYYSTSLASVITRPISKTSWAYPNEKEHEKIAYYKSDDEIRELVESAGDNGGNEWTLGNDGKYYNQNGQPLKYTFTIAGDTEDHPAYDMFVDAQTILNRCGFQIEVIKSPNALKSLATGTLEVWAAAWSSPLDPDMYQVYHKDSTATSVKNWGYPTIMADSTGQFAEEQTLINELADLIEEGRETINQDERKATYKKALNKVMELCVELPTYQRKDLVVYNKDVINVKTLNTKNATHMNGVTNKLWEIEFSDGTEEEGGNGLVIGLIIGAVVILGGAVAAVIIMKNRKKPQSFVLDESSAEEVSETEDEAKSETAEEEVKTETVEETKSEEDKE